MVHRLLLLTIAFSIPLSANYLGAPPQEEACGLIVDNDHAKREDRERPNLYDEQFDELRNGSAYPRPIPHCRHCCQPPCNNDNNMNNSNTTPQE